LSGELLLRPILIEFIFRSSVFRSRAAWAIAVKAIIVEETVWGIPTTVTDCNFLTGGNNMNGGSDERIKVWFE
jgi:hypothetical protein